MACTLAATGETPKGETRMPMNSITSAHTSDFWGCVCPEATIVGHAADVLNVMHGCGGPD